ncbi:MAG: hypothetical protein IJ983_01490 [Kiritimatiellae bacterium]|nr:hypothetical protein [Kiritimatiellia bacterium]
MAMLTSSLSCTVVRPVQVGEDSLGNPVYGEPSREVVGGVLVSAPSTASLDADRPEGYSVALSVHFPKDYTASLKGCSIELPSPWPTVRVIGDPQPLMEELTPGRWNREAFCEVADG